MKKFLCLIAILSLAAPALKGQSFSQENFNLALFGDINAEYENANTHGSNAGAYLAWQEDVRGGAWLLGVFTMFDISSSVENLNRYSGSNQEYTGGITIGYCSEGVRQMFLGANLGLKYARGRGQVNTPLWAYSDDQKDVLFYASAGSTIWWRSLPKTQWQAVYQSPLISTKEADWNNAPVTAVIWDKTYIGLSLKQSLARIQVSADGLLYPKIIASYDYTGGNGEHRYGLGGELSLSRSSHDDWLSVYVLYKISHELNDVASIGIILNLGAL